MPTSRIRSMKIRLRSTSACTRCDELLVLDQDLGEPREPAVGQVAGEPADAPVRVRHPRAGQRGQVLVHEVADHHEVEERRHRAQLHQPGGHARQVIDEARILGQQRAQVAAARRDLDPHQLLDRFAIGEVVDQRRDVVEAVDVGDEVVPGVRLALLLEAAVQVAGMDVGAQHALAVELGDDLHGPVRGRVRRPDVDDDGVVAVAVVERGPDGIGELGVHGASVRSGRARAAARGPSGSPCAAGARRSPRRAGPGAGRRCRESRCRTCRGIRVP